ncbi:MAG TPA: exodeoxyribonuclease III [Myxococcota bacterium]|nr:exodeoxyribonuclease III [Myxococcota bacterium]
MKLATWNVNSIRARADRARAWLEERRPDVVCLQETKVPDEGFPALEYHALGYESTLWGQKAYNGVAILTRAPASDVVRGFGDGGDDSQARFLGVKVGGVRVFCCYVPNGQAPGTDKYAYKLDWLWRLRRYLDQRCDPGEALVLCGDMNVAPEDRDVWDPLQWKEQILCSTEERAALERVRAWGLVDVFRAQHPEPGHYSWWDYQRSDFKKNRGLRIDHLFVTPPVAARAKTAWIDRAAREGQGASDHAPVVLELDG